MSVTINIFGIGGIVVLAILVGYFIGRSESRAVLTDEADGMRGEDGGAEEKMRHIDRLRPNGSRRIMQGKSVASPATGKVAYFADGGRKGVLIEPEQGRIYSPVSGKIVKLYPMGNAFIIRSHEQEAPMELLIRVGKKQPDELSSMYFRCCIVQNEIVNKGKLLLEFDKESLLAAGEEVGVTVCPVAGVSESNIMITQEENVKVGEEIFSI